jgi:hypothetical protein
MGYAARVAKSMLHTVGKSTISLFVIGGAALVLLCIGIHNSGDTVTYIAVEQRNSPSS